MGDERLVSRRRDLSNPNVSIPLKDFPLRKSLACATKATNADKISLRTAKLIPVINDGSSNDKYKVEGNPYVPLDEGRRLYKGQSTATIIRPSPLSARCCSSLLFLNHASMSAQRKVGESREDRWQASYPQSWGKSVSLSVVR
jgi:hypothetical protein